MFLIKFSKEPYNRKRFVRCIKICKWLDYIQKEMIQVLIVKASWSLLREIRNMVIWIIIREWTDKMMTSRIIEVQTFLLWNMKNVITAALML